MEKFYAAHPDWDKVEKALGEKLGYVEKKFHYVGEILKNNITYFANGIKINARQNTPLEDEVVEVYPKENLRQKIVNSYMTHAGITIPLTLIGMRMGIAAVQGWMDGHHSLDEIVNSIGNHFQPTTEHTHDAHEMFSYQHTDSVAGHDINIPGQEITNNGHDIALNHDGYTTTSIIDSQHVTGTVTGYDENGQAIVHVPTVTQDTIVPAHTVPGTLDLSKISLEGSEQFSGKIVLTGGGTQDGTLTVDHVTDYNPGTSTTTGEDVYKGTYTFNGEGDMSGVKADINIHVKDGIATYEMNVPQVIEHTTIAAHDEPVDIKNVVPGQNIDLTVPKTTMTTVAPQTTGLEHEAEYKTIVPAQTAHVDGYTVSHPVETFHIDGYVETETSPWFWEKVTAFTVGLTAGARTIYNLIVDKIYKPKQDEAYKELKKASRKLRGTGIRRRARAENPDLDALMREQNLEARVEENGAAEGGAEDEEMQAMEPIEPEAPAEPQAPAAPEAQAPGPQPPAEEPAEDDGMGQA